MGKCKVFTNSSSDLSPQLAKQYNIVVIPDVIIFKNIEYLSYVDINPLELYKMMRESQVLPTTSHPNEYMYADSFRTAQAYDEILCINVTSLMSGSYQAATSTARALAEEGFKPRVYTYDSRQASYGLSLMAIEAAKLAEEGKTAREIIEHLDTIKDKVGVYFVLRSLENAKKGGRVGEIKSLAATLLGIHPILNFRDGTIKEVRLMRSFEKAVLQTAEYYRKNGRKGGKVFVFHANNEPDAQRIIQRVLDIDPQADIHMDWISAALGVYAGEGTVGVAFLE